MILLGRDYILIKLAIVGIGGVGRAFLKLLNDKKISLKKEGLEFIVTFIMNSKGGVFNKDGIDIDDYLKLSKHCIDIDDYYEKMDFNEMLQRKNIDFLIEITPTNKETGEPGLTYIRKALEHGINVVTSNKGPILLAYKTLRQIARDNGVQLGIGCTTGGALPAINGGIIDLAGSDILSIEGVLNGTTNYIINEMEKKDITYEQALLKAQKAGIAETDSYLDVEGWDTAIKLLILTNVLLGSDKTLDDVSIKGITHITSKDIQNALSKGMKYKLIGKALKENNDITIDVGLKRIGKDDPFFFVDGKNKAVRYQSDTLGDLVIMGGQSDVVAAAASILRDIVNVKRGYRFI